MKKLTKIPTTPRPPPCAPPSADRMEEVKALVPVDFLKLAEQCVSKSDAATLDYEIAFPRDYVDKLLDVMADLLSQDPNVVLATAPYADARFASDCVEQKLSCPHLLIVGDLHGTFASLTRALALNSEQYVFTGDYVDRGGFSVEVLVTLLTLKLFDYEKFILLRGNHETESIASSYSFLAELYCKYERPAQLFKKFVRLFEALPICCRIGDVLALHGGISRHTVQQLSCLNRFREPQSGSALANVLWGDPVECGGFAPNLQRGIGLFFGPDAADQFCQENGLRHIIRSHTCVDGVEIIGKTLTVFSVPQYMEGNSGAFLQVVRARVGAGLGDVCVTKYKTSYSYPEGQHADGYQYNESGNLLSCYPGSLGSQAGDDREDLAAKEPKCEPLSQPYSQNRCEIQSQDRPQPSSQQFYEVLCWHKFTAPPECAIDAVFFYKEAQADRCSPRYLVAAVLCGLLQIDYAFPERAVARLVAVDGSFVELPHMSEARLARLIMELELLCEVQETTPLAVVSCFEAEAIQDILLIDDLTLSERGITLGADVFLPVFSKEDLQRIADKIAAGKKAKRGK